MNIKNEQAPPKRDKKPRLTEEMKRIMPGQCVVLCPKTARCLVSYLRYNGMESRIKKLSPTETKVWAV
jgi:hypothetical protein